jgi:hypothetical protein
VVAKDIGDGSNPRGSGCFGLGSDTAVVATGPAADRIDLRQTGCGARSVPVCGVDLATVPVTSPLPVPGGANHGRASHRAELIKRVKVA